MSAGVGVGERVVAGRLSGGGSPGVALCRRGGSRAKPEGRPRLRSARSLARARSLAYAAAGWPGVFPWIRRSRLDIDKWLTEGEPNTAPLLHMQGHPFVRAGVGWGGKRTVEKEGGVEGVATTTAGHDRRVARDILARFSLFLRSSAD